MGVPHSFSPTRRCAVSRSASERRGNNLKGVKDFYLEAKVRIWP